MTTPEVNGENPEELHITFRAMSREELIHALAEQDSPLLESVFGGAFDDEPEDGESGEPTIVDNGEVFSFQPPYYRTMMRIDLGLDPPEKMTEVSGGKMYYEDGRLHMVVDKLPDWAIPVEKPVEENSEPYPSDVTSCVPEGWRCQPFGKEGFGRVHGHFAPDGGNEPSEVYYVDDDTGEIFKITPWWEEVIELPNREAVLGHLSLHDVKVEGVEYRP